MPLTAHKVQTNTMNESSFEHREGTGEDGSVIHYPTMKSNEEIDREIQGTAKSRLLTEAVVWICLILISILGPTIYKTVTRMMARGSATERVVVFFPDDWNKGDFRNCWLGPKDNAVAKAAARAFSANEGLPHLSCQFEAGTTPWHTFVMDVRFSGKKVAFDEQAWTCQRTEESLVCRN